jgi:hypothetical protein
MKPHRVPRAVHALEIDDKDVPQYHAILAMMRYVSSFSFGKGSARLQTRPRDEDLVWLAERFQKYLKGRGSLDKAFELPSGRKGRGSAKQRLRRWDLQGRAIAIFEDARNRGLGVKRALGEVETKLHVSRSVAHSLVYGRAA